MKKQVLFFTFLTIVVFSQSQDWVEFSPSESTNVTYDVIISTDSHVEFDISIPGMYSTNIDTFNRVMIKEHFRTDSVGYPEMPVLSFIVAIPACSDVQLQLNLLDSTKFSNFNIYPAPELIADTTESGAIALLEQFAYDTATYQSNTWLPMVAAEVVDKGAIRAQHVVRVLFYPLRFNPVNKEIWAYSKAKVTLTFTNPTSTIHQETGIFNEVIGNTLINYTSNGLNASVNLAKSDPPLDCEDFWVTSLLNQQIDDPCDYLIIAPYELFENDDLCALANHRTTFNGFDVKIVTTDVIENDILPAYDDLEEKIFTLIKNTYHSENAAHTYDGKLAYVNLFGDVFMESSNVGIPSFQNPIFPVYGGSDVIYTQLTQVGGNYDIYPDLMIGRCSVDNEE